MSSLFGVTALFPSYCSTSPSGLPFRHNAHPLTQRHKCLAKLPTDFYQHTKATAISDLSVSATQDAHAYNSLNHAHQLSCNKGLFSFPEGIINIFL